MTTAQRISSAVLGAALAACTRLPAEWRDAAAVEKFTQSGCTHKAGELRDHPRERVTALAAGQGRLRVEYLHAHFRCDQRVRGFAKVTSATVAVLVQPVDMNPSSVAKCNCLYDIKLEVPRLAAGTYDVTVHRQRDNWHSPSDPVRIGSARVSVP
jgi:hypothetical protein